jgi:hypothetical protein
MEECMKVLDRIMDQLYNHPEEMRARILSNSYTHKKMKKEEAVTQKSAIELLQSMS